MCLTNVQDAADMSGMHAQLHQYGGVCRLAVAGNPRVDLLRVHSFCGRPVTAAFFGLEDLFADECQVTAGMLLLMLALSGHCVCI